MVGQTKASTNRSKLLDSFDFVFNFNLVNPQILSDLYLNDALSTTQIARKYNCSRGHVLKRLKDHDIYKKPSKAPKNPNNFRGPVPPYGFQVKSGRLVRKNLELIICNLIVKLRAESKSFQQIANELEREGHINRHGKIRWTWAKVHSIYNQWNTNLKDKEKK